jgi:hypothetical protein
MLNWPTPTSFTEVRGFLGLTGYYRKFIRHYGIMTEPLTSVLKHKSFSWSVEAEATFKTLKLAMCSAPVLSLPDFAEPFEIETDACDTGVGTILY